MSEQSHYLQLLGITPWTERHSPQPVVRESLPQANLMFIGDEPFVGRDDQLLTDMVKTIKFERNQVLITCTSLLDKQIASAQPQLLVALGSSATQYLLKTEASLESLRNRVHYYGENKIPLIITYHPADLLRHPADKKNAFLDLQFIRRTLVADSQRRLG